MHSKECSTSLQQALGFFNNSNEKNDKPDAAPVEWLGKGGLPKIPPVFGARVKIYDENLEVKIDKDGRPYVGMGIEELQTLEENEKLEIFGDKPTEIDELGILKNYNL